ncbi:MAG: CDP-diacylglycerol--serine O-phosphatidyltransferase [Aeromicrobium sp.]
MRERGQQSGARNLFARWRVESHSGAEVISLRQLSARERLRVTAPSMLTTANMACGFSSVLLAFNHWTTSAAVLVCVAILFDIFDGAAARLVGATSPFGVQLDSLADLISFGLAPAVLVYTWVLPEWPITAWFAAFFWLACATFRLARFNFTIDPTADKRYFVGMPSPGAAAVVVATIFALDQPDFDALQAPVGPAILLPAVISILPAFLMVSTVRFRSFRGLINPKTTPARVTTALALVAIAVGLLVAPAATGLVVAYSYVLTPPLGVLTAPLRGAIFGPDAVAPPRVQQRSVFLSAFED